MLLRHHPHTRRVCLHGYVNRLKSYRWCITYRVRHPRSITQLCYSFTIWLGRGLRRTRPCTRRRRTRPAVLGGMCACTHCATHVWFAVRGARPTVPRTHPDTTSMHTSAHHIPYPIAFRHCTHVAPYLQSRTTLNCGGRCCCCALLPSSIVMHLGVLCDDTRGRLARHNTRMCTRNRTTRSTGRACVIPLCCPCVIHCAAHHPLIHPHLPPLHSLHPRAMLGALAALFAETCRDARLCCRAEAVMCVHTYRDCPCNRLGVNAQDGRTPHGPCMLRSLM